MSLRWVKHPRETGLAAIGAKPRGHYLKYGQDVVASVSAVGGGAFHGPLKGWSFTIYDYKPLLLARHQDKKVYASQAECLSHCSKAVNDMIRNSHEKRTGT